MRERLTLLALMAVALIKPGSTLWSTTAPSNNGPKYGIYKQNKHSGYFAGIYKKKLLILFKPATSQSSSIHKKHVNSLSSQIYESGCKKYTKKHTNELTVLPPSRKQ